MSDLFGFVNDLETIIYGLGFKLILKNNNDRALFFRSLAIMEERHFIRMYPMLLTSCLI